MQKLQYIEVTEELALAMLGKDNPSPITCETCELADWVEYIIKGVKMRVIHNFTSDTVQYYLQDINA